MAHTNYKQYRLIEHTADTGLIAQGNSLAEAFANAGIGMFAIITDLRKIKLIESRTIEVEEENYEYLLFEWLNRLLYYFDTEGMVFRHITVTHLSRQQLVTACWGERIDINRHIFKNAVKAATFHLLNIDEVNKKIKVIFDV